MPVSTQASVSGLLSKLKEKGPMAMNAQQIEEDDEELMRALGMIPEAAQSMQPAEALHTPTPMPGMRGPASQVNPAKKPLALKNRYSK